ncbi:S8 family serine peptidase [bacterium]|nr:S8 family serine peptidase [bacterium]
MKTLSKLFLVSLLIAGLINADDYYWSLGHKIQITKQENLAVVRNTGRSTINADNSLTIAMENVNAKAQKWPKEFNRANGKYQLIDVDFDLLKGQKIQEQYILPVFKDNTGELVLPTENIIIGIQKDKSKSEVEKLTEKYGLKLKSFDSPMPGMAVLTVPTDKSDEIIELANKLKIDSETRWAHPDFIVPHYKRAIVNDPLFNIQWHLTNDGSLPNTIAGADAKVAGAWNTTMGTSSVRVCVYDDSVEKDHEDLAPNFVAGLDLDTMGPDPSPKVLEGPNAEIHGTACSGVAVARGNNGIGVSGAAPYCSLMGIRWGTVSSSDTAGFFWARTNGADVISCSWGTQMNDALYEAIRDAAINGRNGLGIPIFFAAGNDNKLISSTDPAQHPNVICVTASNAQDGRANYSSYGSSASIAAPSNSSGMPGITTTDYMGNKGYSSDNYCRATDDTGFGGTSSATPLAAGIAALCISVETNLTYLNVKALLQESADKISSNNYPYVGGWNQYFGYGRINAMRAVVMAPGYTNTPSAHNFEMTAHKGKINLPKNKFKAKLRHDFNLNSITNAVTITLDNVIIAQFTGGGAWKWNKKQTRGKNKNAGKDLIKFIAGKKGGNTVMIKLKNVSGATLKNQMILKIQFNGGPSGMAVLTPDAKGKIKQ